MTLRLFAMALALSFAFPSLAQNITDQAKRQIASLLLEKTTRTPAQRKVASNLLHAAKMQRGLPITAEVPRLSTALPAANPDAAGAVEVDVLATVSQPLLDLITQLGGTVITAHPQWQAIRATLPLLAIEQLAAHPNVKQITPADHGRHNGPPLRSFNRHDRARALQAPFAAALGSLGPPQPLSLARLFQSIGSLFFVGPDTPGDIAHRANLVRSQLNITGAGVSIGVISDGVTSLGAEQAAGRLPANVTILSGQSGVGPGPCPGPNCPDEGTAMLEIVYTLAPGAHLFFATSGPNPAQMATNITNLAAAGCTVIVDDITFFNEGIYQDGPIAQTVNTVASQGVFYFSSAANSGNLDSGQSGTWEGDYLNSNTTIPAIAGSEAGNVHDWGGGIIAVRLTKHSGPLFLKWSDPLGASSNDYDLFALDSTGASVIGASTGTQSGTQDPIEFIPTTNGNTVLIPDNSLIAVVNFQNAAQVRALHLDTERGRLGIGTAGATFGHNAAASAITLAAIDVAQANGGPFTGGTVETFSSDGPRRMFFNPNGTPISGGVTFASGGGITLQKPDYTAADGVPTGLAPNSGFNPFFGTSAAAPHAAAIGALIRQAKPSITLAQLRTALTTTAIDIHASGWDRDSGFGIINALAAVQSVLVASTVTVTINSTVTAGPGTGLAFSVSGANCSPGSYTTPAQLTWTSGATCTVTFTAQQFFQSGGLFDNFTGWADGPTSNPRNFTAPSSNATYTGQFASSYYLLTQASPSAGGSVSPPSGYFAAGSTVNINSTPNSGFTFAGWTGTGTGSYTGPNAASSVTMNAPISQTASFTGGGGGPYTLRLNAGGSVYNDPQGNIWSPDPNVANTFTFFTQNPIRNTDKSFLYQSERFSIGTPFSYSFSGVPNGNYIVRLRFAETYFTQAGQRSFSVSLNGAPALTNFDIAATAGGSNTAVDTIHAVTVSSGALNVQFTPVLSNPKISAIEVFPATTTVALAPGVSAPLGPNQTQQFNVTVLGNANTGVTWSLSPSLGSISPTGLYTAPAVIANATRVTLTATSAADGTQKASSTIQLVPATWTTANIGTPEIAGSATLNTNAFNMTGGGDLNGAADSFRLAVTTLNNSSDGSIIARVNQPFTGANPNKAGVMIRDTPNANSAYGMMSYFAGIVGLLQTRTSAGGGTVVQFGAAGVPWMRLTKVGTMLSGYVSNDATNWIPVGVPQSVPMGATQGIGLSVSDGFTGGGNAVTFDNVEVSTSTVAVSINEGLSSLGASQQAQFSSIVTGTANTAVTWSISPAGQGSITGGGLYTAPASIANPSLQTVTVTATSVADPSKSASVVVFLGGFVPVRVNCGGPSHYDPLGNFWSGDSNAVGGIGNVYSSGASIANTQTPYIYQSERFNAAAPLSYKFFVPPGSYTVTLKFAEIFFTTAGNRVMNIAINGNAVASNFDAVALAGANTAIDRVFSSISPLNGAITITVSPAVAGHSPKVNAIQIQ